MNTYRKIIFAGTTASGSSALYDYFYGLPNCYGLKPEFKKEIRLGVYKKYAEGNFKNRQHYSELFESTINCKFLNEFESLNSESILLLNNVVSCLMLRSFELVKKGIIFCVLRDPRSTWVQRKNSRRRKGITTNVTRFINGYRRHMQTFYRDLGNLRYNGNRVYVVHLEDFILDENCKRWVLRMAGFDYRKYPKNPPCKPWPKEQNIYLHRHYRKQTEIQRIAEELKEYCHPKI